MNMPTLDADLITKLEAIVGPQHIVLDEHERRYLSSDFFYWPDAGVAAVGVAPSTADEVAAVLRTIAQNPREVSIRGGGMSTGRSYVPGTNTGVMLDMRRLNKVREVNPIDRYIVVEAGCTWVQVREALAPHRMRTDFTMPLSGNVSTVGGAMAHNVTGGMKGILGLEVVRANGDVVHTGSWGRREHGTPYYRDYGPDLTGLFLGDTGAFGVKTAASLHISQLPEASAFASFSFEDSESLIDAMVALSAFDFITMRSAFDPYLTRSAMHVSVQEGVRTLAAVVRAETSVLRGIKNAVGIAARGQSAADEAKWTLHVRADQFSLEGAERALGVARDICLKQGTEMAPSMAIAMGANPLTVRGSLSRDGRRWIATNSVWPLSRAREGMAKVLEFLASRSADFEKHDVKVGHFLTCSGLHFQIEPLFWWYDKVSELSLRHIDAAEAERFRQIPENPANREFIRHTRTALRDLLQENGAIHVHTSKFFRYAEILEPGVQVLLRDLKDVLDPQHILNPGNLGLKRG